MSNTHTSVLLEESIDALSVMPGGVYIDGTFGRGGHSRAILAKLGDGGRLIAIDKDEEAIAYAKALFSNEPRFEIVHDSFSNLAHIAKARGVYGNVNGILLDLGVSSPQLDDAERGFSFMKDGPLDMRMDKTQRLMAKTWLSEASVTEMTRVFKIYGEERFAKKIANAIVSARVNSPLETTAQLANLIKAVKPKVHYKKHPATQVFQAIRIVINRELEDVETVLPECLSTLAVGGRLAVISFHSLEDRIVKHFMRNEERGERLPLELPISADVLMSKHTFKRIGKAIRPSNEEIATNVRARSATLRIGEKLR